MSQYIEQAVCTDFADEAKNINMKNVIKYVQSVTSIIINLNLVRRDLWHLQQKIVKCFIMYPATSPVSLHTI